MTEPLIVFLCICSGVRRDALQRAPQGRAQAATLGALMLLTSFVSLLTSGYALHEAFVGSEYAGIIAVGGGLVWATVVFCIDRLLILGVDKFASPGRIALQLLVRVPLAVAIALVMSKPLVLRLCETVIGRELRQEAHNSITSESEFNDRLEGLSDRRKGAEEIQAAVYKQRDRLKSEPDSFRYQNAKRVAGEAEARYKRTVATNGPRIARANQEIVRFDRADAQDDSSAARISALLREVATLRGEIARDESAFKAAASEKQAAAQDWLEKETAQLDALTAQLNPALAAHSEAENKVASRNGESETEINRLTAPNLINKYTGLRRVTSNPKNPDAAAARDFELAMDGFFLVLELLVITSKTLMKKCALDYATAAVELMDREQINLNANTELTHRQALAEAVITVKEEAVKAWRDGQVAKLRSKPPTTADLEQLWQELEKLAA
jgi:hypothetical protein